MSEESLDYLKLCSHYYSNCEDGCCMETCEYYQHNDCPVHYVNGLLEEKDKAIESWETMYKSVMQTCHNDKEEIERLNKQLADLQQEQIAEMKEHQEAMELADKTITNLVEDNRASQEWYKKQLDEKDEQLEYFSERDEEQEKQLEKQAEFHRKSVLELKQQLAESEEFLVATKWKVQDLNKQLADTEEQNKRVLEKLELIVSANQELEQKLAEKDKEIDEVRSNHANLVADIAYKAVNVYTAESKKTGVPTFYKIHYSQLLEIEDMENLRNYAQDKISFALEQLEKVKEIMSKSNESGYIIRFASMNDRDKFNETINNQIKAIKETE